MIRFGSQRMRPVVHVQQDHVVGTVVGTQQRCHITFVHPHAGIRERIASERCEQPPIPGDHRRNQFRHRDRPVSGQGSQRCRRREAHAEATDQHCHVFTLAPPSVSPTRESFLRAMGAAAHQFIAAIAAHANREVAHMLPQAQLAPAGNGSRLKKDPRFH